MFSDDKRFLITYIDEDTNHLYVTAYFYPDLIECPNTCHKCDTIENYGDVCSECEFNFFVIKFYRNNSILFLN